MDYGAYLKRQKYWLRQASAQGRGFVEFFCIIGRTVRLVAERSTAPIRLKIGNIRRSRISQSVPVQNDLIFFYTFQGDYTCNPRYICEELIRRGVPARIIWSCGRRPVQMRRDDFPANAELVTEGSREFYEALSSARIWIVNSTEFLKKPVPKKNNQIMIQTWHGSLGIKRFGNEVIEGSDLARASRLSSSITDIIVSNSEFEDNVYRETYWPENRIERWGHARNDILINNNELAAAAVRVRKYYDIPAGSKIVLYAPTFRDDHLFDDYAVDFARVLESLRCRFEGNWYFMVRFHPSVRKEAEKFRNDYDNYIDATDYADIQELMAAADAAITDYSSWIFDYVLTGRPGFIYAADSDRYERSFYYPLSSTPFPVASDNDQLAANIINFDGQKYSRDVMEFLKEKRCVDDGHASERAADEICNLLTFK